MRQFLCVTYHSIVNKNKIRGQFIFWVFIAIFRKMNFFAISTKMTKLTRRLSQESKMLQLKLKAL
jgi:hypothetical protein